MDRSDGHQPPVPGGVYLCQVTERVSCAACCGLYNVPEASRAVLESILIDRTQGFEGIPREADAIEEFGRRMLNRLGSPRPFPDFHHCPFVGLIGEKKGRVGCLLHPLAEGNNGIDYRGLSHYGGMACRLYFCPSHHRLSGDIKTAMRETADSWYEYGLIITETAMLKAFFSALEKRVGMPVKAGDILRRGECRRELRKISQLKIDWPYRRKLDQGPCNYVFDDHLYDKPHTSYPPLTKRPSPYDGIFRELGSNFELPDDLGRAENLVGGLIETLALQIAAGRFVQSDGKR